MIFIIEAILMFILPLVNIKEGATVAMLDAASLTILLLPALHYLVLRPLTMHARERMFADEAKIQEEKKFRAIVETSNDAIIMMDNEGRIIFWNDAAEDVFGYKPEEAVGKDMHQLIVPQDKYKAFRDGFKVFLETGTGPVVGRTIEVQALRKSGEVFHVELSVSAVKIKEKWNAIGFVRDITDRYLAQKELSERVVELERFAKATTTREFRIQELLDRVKELEEGLGRVEK
ncbi:MAG: PAS domain S-box protein [Deltaproteobacteria bacterium]|nr:PAS domain S-box protein [Deltaproteobacteria bacterium]